MNGREQQRRSARAATRYAALGIAIVGFAGLGLSFFMASSFGSEQASRRRIETYHLRSTALASQLGVRILNLRHAAHELETSPASPHRVREELAPALAEMSSELGQLDAAHRSAGEPRVGPAHERMLDRFARFEELLGAWMTTGTPPDHDELHRVDESLGLAVEQIRRLHDIEGRRQMAGLAAQTARRSVTIWTTATLFALAVSLIGWQVFALLRGAFAREQELHITIGRAQRNQQRVAKMEALGRLAGGVAHDFNNLLTVILAHAEELRESLRPGSPALRETEGIERATNQAAALTSQLLTFSRPDPSDPSEPRLLDLNGAILSMEVLLGRLLGKRSTLVMNLEPELGAVRCDPREIERVLVNLVSNAGDAMPTGGTVTIETRNLRSKPDGEENEEQDMVQLSVSDSGVGMDEELRDRVFEPFFTTKQDKQGTQGTGLGLSTVHGIVTRSGGWVRVESELRIGTRLEVHLPRHAAEPEGDLESEASPQAPGSGTILLVDDEREVRRVSARVLRDAGYQVLESRDGATALELCSEWREPINLILTDVVMPGLTGPELVDRAKPLHPEARILFMSGYTGSELPVGGRLLAKPFRRAELLTEVRSALEV